jgi:uncharacterized damage-inducible protein DinB
MCSKMNDFIELIEYNIWASKRLINQAKDLSHEDYVVDTNGYMNSMRLAFLHMLKADWIWLDLWKGQPIVECPSAWDQFAIDDIDNVWSELQADIIEELSLNFFKRSDEDIGFTNGDEQIHILKFWQTITLAVDHDTYYRGQIASMIDLLGFEPVKTHLFDYYMRRIHS